MENEREQPAGPQPTECSNVRYLDEWRAQHRRYYAAKTEALRGRKVRRNPPSKRPTGLSAGRGPGGVGKWSGSILGAGTPPTPVSYGPRRWTWVVWCLPLAAGLALWLWLKPGGAPPAGPPAAEARPVLHLWAPGAWAQDEQLQAILSGFQDARGVTVRWESRPIDSHELFHALLVGAAPDVILVDEETGWRLVGMDALLPLVVPADGEPVQYVLPLAQETLWVRALRAAIPRRARHPELARALVAYLATAASGGSAAGIQ